MSLETIGKTGRVYLRKFDHNQAQADYQAGESLLSIARRFGVTYNAVYRVVDPERRIRMDATVKKWIMSGVCQDCGEKGISRYAPRCKNCSSHLRITSVRAGTLSCSTCQLWLPDTDFGLSTNFSHRRNRRPICRKCESAKRRAYRERNKVLCQGGCGKLVEGKGRTWKNNPDRPYLCLSCSQKSSFRNELDRVFYTALKEL